MNLNQSLGRACWGAHRSLPFSLSESFPLPPSLPAFSLESQCLAQGLTPGVKEEWMGDGWCEGDQTMMMTTTAV